MPVFWCLGCREADVDGEQQRRNGARGRGTAGVLRASDLLELKRGVAAEAYKWSGRAKGHRR